MCRRKLSTQDGWEDWKDVSPPAVNGLVCEPNRWRLVDVRWRGEDVKTWRRVARQLVVETWMRTICICESANIWKAHGRCGIDAPCRHTQGGEGMVSLLCYDTNDQTSVLWAWAWDWAIELRHAKKTETMWLTINGKRSSGLAVDNWWLTIDVWQLSYWWGGIALK